MTESGTSLGNRRFDAQLTDAQSQRLDADAPLQTLIRAVQQTSPEFKYNGQGAVYLHERIRLALEQRGDALQATPSSRLDSRERQPVIGAVDYVEQARSDMRERNANAWRSDASFGLLEGGLTMLPTGRADLLALLYILDASIPTGGLSDEQLIAAIELFRNERGGFNKEARTRTDNGGMYDPEAERARMRERNANAHRQ